MIASKSARPILLELEARRLLSAPGTGTGTGTPSLLGAASDTFLNYQAGLALASSINQAGGQWEKNGHITYSFAPDGTDVFGVPSNLDATLAARGIAMATWRDDVREAADAWSAATGITFDLVADDGSPINASGPLEGNPRFGDVRIAGITQDRSVLALTFDPPPNNWGTASGDIIFNTAQPWVIADNDSVMSPDQAVGNVSTIDLPTVLLHEFGHTVGVGELSQANAVEYMTYNGVKRTLTMADTDAVPDPDVAGGIGSPLSLTVTWQPSESLGGQIQLWNGSLAAAGDSSTVNVAVAAPGFYEIIPAWTIGGAVTFERTGPDGTVEIAAQGSTGMDLAAGVYQFRAVNAGTGPVRFGVAFFTPSYTLESLLFNGVGQVPAASLAILGQVEATTTPTATVSVTARLSDLPLPLPLPLPSVGYASAIGGVPVGHPVLSTDHISVVGPVGVGGRVALSWGGAGLPNGVIPGRSHPKAQPVPNRDLGGIAVPATLATAQTRYPEPATSDQAGEVGPSVEMGGGVEAVGYPTVADNPGLIRDLEALGEPVSSGNDDAGSRIHQLASFGDPAVTTLLAFVMAYGRERFLTWKKRSKRPELKQKRSKLTSR